MTPRPRLLLALALLSVACHRSTPSPTPEEPAGSGLPSSTRASARPPSASAAAVSTPPTGAWAHGFAAFRGTVGAPGATQEIRLALDRRGLALEALYGPGEPAQRGESIKAIPLHGEIKDGSRFVLEEQLGTESKGATAEGRLVGDDRIEGTWKGKDGDPPVPFTAARFAPLGAAGERFDESYEGRLGAASRIRAELHRAADELRGSYRYGHSQHDLILDGAVSEPDGTFALRETGDKGALTGRIEGIFLGRDLALGRWSSRTNTRTFPIYLETAGRYAAVALESGARVIADDILALSHCSGQDNGVFPRVTGAALTAGEATLNGALRDAAREHLVSVKDCEQAKDVGVAPWTDLGYAVTPTRKGGFALELDWFVNGGARGNHGRSCFVADAASGRLVDLRGLLRAEARGKLSRLLGEATLKFYAATDLSRVPLTAEDVDVARAALCATPGGLLLQLEPRPPGDGHNWDHIEVELPAREARPLFEKSDVIAALFDDRGG